MNPPVTFNHCNGDDSIAYAASLCVAPVDMPTSRVTFLPGEMQQYWPHTLLPLFVAINYFSVWRNCHFSGLRRQRH